MLKQIKPAIRSVLVMTVAFGLMFPLVITGVARVVFPRQAGGSLLQDGQGRIIGSEIIGQGFSGSGYFHPRPSAAGGGYDASASGGTNLGPNSDKLINGIHQKLPDGADAPGNFDGIRDLVNAYRLENGLPPGASVPPDAVTRSASGLDPHISPANAFHQTARVARARGWSQDQVRRLVDDTTEGRQFGLLGEPRVNVLKLNLALDKLKINSKQSSRP